MSLAVSHAPVAEELFCAFTVSVEFDDGLAIDVNLPFHVENHTIGVIGNLEYMLPAIHMR